MAGQQVPLIISVAPFPEGFQGDMDETWQQGALLMSAFVEGNFLTGLILPPGSDLPTTDQGPIAMGGVWYFWDPATGQYLAQTVSSKIAQNYARNCVYQVQQIGSTIPISNAGLTAVYDMAICRATVPNVLGVSLDVGPPAGADNEFIPAAIKYTVGPALVATPASADLCVHEHLFEGSDVIMLQGQGLSLSFSARTNAPGTYSVYLTNSGRDHSYVSQFTLAANLWTRIKISGIPPMPTASGSWNFGEGVAGLYMGVVMLTGTQWQTTHLNSWQPLFVAGAANNINMLTVVNNQLNITGIKLEASADVTFLSVPTFEDDFEQMQRYYFTTYNDQSTTAGFPILLTAPLDGEFIAQFCFPRRMARIPTVVPYGWGSNTGGQITDMSATPPFDVSVATLAATRKGVSDLQDPVIQTTGTTNSLTNQGNLDGSTGRVTNVAGGTASLAVGMTVSGTGILPGSTVAGILSPTVFQLSLPTINAGTGLTLTFGTNSITAIPSTAGMAVGMPIAGTGIPAGATIIQVVSGTAITISKFLTSFGSGVGLQVSKIAQGDVLRALIRADARLTVN